MIALAGIIVRNSILLVDFIDTEVHAGSSLEDAVVRAAAVRAKPIALTALAAMIGAFFILDDPSAPYAVAYPIPDLKPGRPARYRGTCRDLFDRLQRVRPPARFSPSSNRIEAVAA